MPANGPSKQSPLAILVAHGPERPTLSYRAQGRCNRNDLRKRQDLPHACDASGIGRAKLLLSHLAREKARREPRPPIHASLRRTSMPRWMVSSLAAKEMREWVSRRLKMLPGVV